jgi:CheY-like chemotaxis protein
MDRNQQKPYQILLVDDDQLTREMYAQRIEQEPELDVVQAKDGQEAWEYLQEREVDLVFTGINMPRMSGFDLIRNIKASEQYASMPIFVSSHMGRPEDKELALSLGVTRFITRGKHTPNEVVSIIRSEVIGKLESYKLVVSPNSPDYELFVDDFFGGVCPNCVPDQQLPVILLCHHQDGKYSYEFKLDCKRCNKSR